MEILLDYGIDPSLCGCKEITALHLLIYMPADSIDRAVSMLIAHGAPTDACSEATRLEKLGLELVGTPIEWAVIARHRRLVAVLLPYSKGLEKNILRHAISHAYYEIAEGLLSNTALSGLFTKEDCPLLIFSRAFAHLICHGRDGDMAIERTIRLCNAYGLIDYEAMLMNCICYARTRSCLRALEVLVDLCPPSVILQGFESDGLYEVLKSTLYVAFEYAKSNRAWRRLLEAILRNFSITELDEVRELRRSNSPDIVCSLNVLHMAVEAGWTVAVQVLLEKGVDVHQKRYKPIPMSCSDIAALLGSLEMQGILSSHGVRGENALGSSMAREHPVSWLIPQKRLRRREFKGFTWNHFGDKDASTLFAVSKAHEVLHHLLLSRDAYFSPSGSQYKDLEVLLWDESRALLSNALIAAYINTPDEDDVNMLQRAAAFLDIDVVRLLLEAGADANVPFLATKRASNDESGLTVAFLPFQIACWVSRVSGYVFESGTVEIDNKPDDAVSTQQQPSPEMRRKPYILDRVSRVISHAAESATERIKRLKSGPALTPGAKMAESLRPGSLGVAQELLRWHMLRNDSRFEGITEFHLCTYINYVSRGIMLIKQNYKVADAKASWPGLEGKYTGLELDKGGKWKDEWSTFPFSLRRLRGKELATKRLKKYGSLRHRNMGILQTS
ncbi:MAG: hypothetical protein Q9191_007113 [Dirinaria sp. TL-2023a]